MNYSVGDITRDVRVALDENPTGAALLDTGDVDSLELDAIIAQKIPDGVRSVTQAAPRHLLDDGQPFAGEVTWEHEAGKGMGYTVLPQDFMRLLTFKMSDWQLPVFDGIEDSDPLYLLQRSKFAGIRGNTQKPVCVFTRRATGDRVMEFYSCTAGSEAKVATARYIPYPAIAGGSISICHRLYTPAVYYIAGLVCATYKDKAHADVLFTIANDYLK